MGLSEGCLNIQLLIQNYLCPPIQIDKFFLEMTQVPRRQEKQRKFQTFSYVVWRLSKWNITVLIVFSLARIYWLLQHWTEHRNLEQFGFYMLLLAITAIAREAYVLFEDFLVEICFLLTQRFKLVSLNPAGWPTTSRKPQLGELFMYLLGIAFMVFPLVFGAVPIFREYDPYQLTVLKITHHFKICSFPGFHQLCLKYFVKFLSSTICASTAFHGGSVVLSLILLILLFVHAIQKMSYNLYDRHLKPLIYCKSSKYLIKPVHTGNKLKNRKILRLRKAKVKAVMKITTSFKFSSCLRLFRILDILIRIGNLVVSKFLLVLVAMGILAAAWSGYVMVMCYRIFPLILYLSCSFILPIAMIINFLLITLASIPNQNAKNFKLFWKRYLKNKKQYFQLQSCNIFGYRIGPIRNVQEKTALSIADTILNGMATICLMKLGRAKIRI